MAQKKKSSTSAPPPPPPSVLKEIEEDGKSTVALISPLLWLLRLAGFVLALYLAYQYRMHAINIYGKVIHEFDPWFNYRATEYLSDNGWSAFFKWYDYKSWYPLGRPVGTTIYPGMQIVSVLIHRVLNFLNPMVVWADIGMSLNDVCVYVPVWFGMLASALTGLVAYECSFSINAAVVTAAIMGTIPAHIMRSVGGGFDNESVVMSFMCLTYFFHLRSLRTKSSWWLGIFTGLSYVCTVATWGGYIFPLNLIGVHVAFLVAIGRFTPSLHHAYSLFYVIGTFGATFVPVVGLSPIKSLEQLGPCVVFIVLQLLQFCEMQREKKNLTTKQLNILRFQVFIAAGAVLALLVAYLWPQGYFGPFSSRVRGIFIPHKRTGNPLVDSVSEHQAASNDAYFHYLHYVMYVAPVGFAYTVLKHTNATLFLTIYGLVSYFVSSKMVRLIILLGPISSVLAGIAIGLALDWAIRQLFIPFTVSSEDLTEDEPKRSNSSKKKNRKTKRRCSTEGVPEFLSSLVVAYHYNVAFRVVRKLMAVFIFVVIFWNVAPYYQHSSAMAENLSNPFIMQMATLRNGQTIIIDDYRSAYHWLRDNTPEDSRVMSWWDYGYQITGIANRTTIADGNTWNHEHIATLGLCLVSPVEKAHRMIRHLADYVLVWAGSRSDDIAKSTHIARIGNSVYNHICPGDPTCSQFGFYRTPDGQTAPTPMMEESLIYKLVRSGYPGVHLDPDLFKPVYTSQYGLVRIYKVMKVSKKSKAWVANPENRVCDAPGSWYCTGQYPPALNYIFKNKKDFSQLEDFNQQKQDEEARRYQEEYEKRLSGQGGLYPNHPPPKRAKSSGKVEWQDSAETTSMWQLIHNNDLQSIQQWVAYDPSIVHVRSSDGRGPLWWAYEYKRNEIIAFLIKNGADISATDQDGLTPDKMKK
eukprot:CAMPEP_0174263992 /NCGR_PEP_ID=MMETSP0439-20130205/20885_1 /TAXON_ID=0 /ORGANISM="Stereomyxa ramosa, Strain Chinc5" /LENGTH=916 /DNA_ID=CAMNT_0015349661 /DNA_START=19 /DNA_END=2769 /DNA_ORIENTATION=+